MHPIEQMILLCWEHRTRLATWEQKIVDRLYARLSKPRAQRTMKGCERVWLRKIHERLKANLYHGNPPTDGNPP